MGRSFLLLMALVVTAAVLCVGTYRLAGYWCAGRWAGEADSLDWLRLEFQLSDAELSRVRALHEGYRPQCQAFCDRIAAKKQELEGALTTHPNGISAEVEQALADIGALRAQCQAAMLRHFVEVSRVMPPEQGRRYLAEMQRLTLGQHEQVERRMSGDAGSHGHR